MSKTSEEKCIEKEILSWLMIEEIFFAWKNQTTGIYDPKTKKFRKLKGFNITGGSDIFGIISPCGRFLALEVKTPDTIGKWIKLNQPDYCPKGYELKDCQRAREQKEFLDKINDFGGVAGVVTSLEDAQEIISDGIGVKF